MKTKRKQSTTLKSVAPLAPRGWNSEKEKILWANLQARQARGKDMSAVIAKLSDPKNRADFLAMLEECRRSNERLHDGVAKSRRITARDLALIVT